MSELSDLEATVGRHYDQTVFDYESARLTQECPVEYAITSRYLQRYVAAHAIVAEVGVGVGCYSELLARNGCRLYLVDVAQRLLDTAAQRLRAAGLAEQILGVDRASATHLEFLEASTCQAVLLLGPLYHLPLLEDRQLAVQEAARVLQPGGLVFAAAINRLGYLRDTFLQSPAEGEPRTAFHAQFLHDGNLDPAHAPPLGFAHLSTADELRGLFSTLFDEVLLAGVESFASRGQEVLHGASSDDAEAWLGLVEQTGTTAEGIGASDHFLYIGQRR
jgi:SAM-dependent methyltransferase